jgi:hypothetical protein
MQSSTISNRITSLGVGVLAFGIFATSALAVGGQVIPATEKPKGYSLSDMARATAFFNTSWPHQEDACPNTPFQILYYYEKEGKKGKQDTFTVGPETVLYVPVFYSDDTQPAPGYPPSVNDQKAILQYFYSQGKLGAVYMKIVVDGKPNELGSDYVIGVEPVKLGDAYDDPNTGEHVPAGTQYIVCAAFLTPLANGTHTVQIQGLLTGRLANEQHYWSFDTPIYTVIVH